MSAILGIDIGGSHLVSGLVNCDTGTLDKGSLLRVGFHPNITSDAFLHRLSSMIKTQFHKEGRAIKGVGVSVPGPFDYPNGICRISSVGKLENLFGHDLRQFISNCLDHGLDPLDIRFMNDAEAMLSGYIHQNALRGRVLGITLGTGLGSSFFDAGKVMKSGKGIPAGGMLYNCLFEKELADEQFSSRWLVDTYSKLTGTTATDVKQMAELAAKDKKVKSIFQRFGERLAAFLWPYLDEFEADTLLVGGNLANAMDHFGRELARGLELSEGGIRIEVIQNGEESAIQGAAHNLMGKGFNKPRPPDSVRKTTQFLLPVKKPASGPGKYDIYPTHVMPAGKVREGFEQLAEVVSDCETIVIDGYIGVNWSGFIQKLGQALKDQDKNVSFQCVDAALKPKQEVLDMTRPFMGEPASIFGSRYTGRLEDFFETDLLKKIKAVRNEGISILYGCGAALAGWDSPLIYVDLPKNEIQFRSRAGGVENLGKIMVTDPKEQYKRFYFIDWIALNRHKEELLPHIDWFVDEQRMHEITFTKGFDIRNALREMAQTCFRVRPWFEPGPWGGQWIRQHIEGLADNVPNYAWSFELIVPENGLLLESDGIMLECSFDFLMFARAAEILGHAHDAFGNEFPIRFDFLDTFDGGNLSVQCHPRPEYIKTHFGESFTQDETYYILDAGEKAEVYLGFQEDIEPAKFKKVLEESHHKKKEIQITDFVLVHPAKKHDLFLIPGGTIHASGKDNLVLEISSTPYIFTFKMYDWLRLDLDGNPRPLNIDHAFNNLYFDRKGEKVRKEFISRPLETDAGKNYRIVHLPTHPDHFYDVRRVEFESQLDLMADNRFYVCMLVEGESVTLQIENAPDIRLNYAETFVIAASAGRYRFINSGQGMAKVVQAYVKENIKV